MTEHIQTTPFDVRRDALSDKINKFFKEHSDEAIKGVWEKSAIVSMSVRRGLSIALAAHNPLELGQQIGRTIDGIKSEKLQILDSADLSGEDRKIKKIRVNCIFDGTIPDSDAITQFKEKGPTFYNDTTLRTQSLEETIAQTNYGRHLVARLKELQRPTSRRFAQLQRDAAVTLGQLAYVTAFEGKYSHQNLQARLESVQLLTLLARRELSKELHSQSVNETDQVTVEAPLQEEASAEMEEVREYGLEGADTVFVAQSGHEANSNVYAGSKGVEDLLKKMDDLLNPNPE